MLLVSLVDGQLLLPGLHEVGDPVVEVAVFSVVVLHLFGPDCLLEVLQLLHQLVEDVLAHFLGHEKHQPIRQDGDMVVDQCVAHVLEPLGAQVGHFHHEVLEVQQLLPFHVALGVHLVVLQVLLELVDALGENGYFVRLGPVLEADAPEEGGAVFEERDGKAHLEEAYFFQLGGFFQVVRLFAEREALGIQLDEVGHDERMLDVDLQNAPRLELHQRFVCSH